MDARNKKYEIRKCRLLTNSKMNMQVMIYRYVCVITNCYWCSSLYICVSIHAISNLCLNHVRICLPPAASTPIAKNRTWQNAYHWKKHQVKNPHSLSSLFIDMIIYDCVSAPGTRHQSPASCQLHFLSKTHPLILRFHGSRPETIVAFAKNSELD